MKLMKTKLIAASVGLALMGSAASAVTVYSDDFNRANNDTVGNNWSELEMHDNDVRIRNNRLQLRDSLSGAADAAASTTTIDLSGLHDATLNFRWRARGRNEIDDVLNVAWSTERSPSIDAPELWTSLGTFSAATSTWASEVLSLGAAANGQVIRLLFWTDVSEGNGGNREGFAIDNVTLTAVPLPAGAPLLLAGLAGLGLTRRRRNADKA